MRKLTHDEIGRKRITLEQSSKAERHPIFVLCDNIRSIYNVGSIFRTSDAALIKKLYLTGYTPHPPRHEIEKVALGATKAVPWEYVSDPLDVVRELKRMNVRIACLEITDSSRNYTDVSLNEFPICLVLGNELTGVSSVVISESDFSLEIPQFGYKHSINVSVAYGIAVMELVRIFRSQG